jgi:hypothetical protein
MLNFINDKNFLIKLFNFLIFIYYFIKRKIFRGKLPDFVIIGAQKSGTQALIHHLKKHPQINILPRFYPYKSYNKLESRFFSNNELFNRGIDWYKTIFNYNGKLQGDNTPEYISNFIAHERMHKIIPNAKLILILRDPVYRAYSAYNHYKQRLPDSKNWFYLPDKNFKKNILEEIKNDFKNGFINRGFYIDHIEHLLKYFHKSQLLILIKEQIEATPSEAYEKVYNFLGIKKIYLKFNKRIHSRKYTVEPLTDDVIKLLLKIYQPYNNRLFSFLDYKIEEWTNV